MKNDKRYRYVPVKGLQVLGVGGHGKVYRLTDDSVIKVYHDGSSLEVIERERDLARTAFVAGIPSAITFDTVITEDGFGTIFELAGGTTLGSFMHQHKDKIDEYTDRYVDIIKQFHNCSVDKDKFQNIKDEYIRRINAIKYFNDDQKNALIEVVKSIPEGDGYVHSDIHPNNLLINDKDEILIIDMADLSYGHSIFDIGGNYMTLVMSFSNKKAGKEIVGMEKEEAYYVYRRLLSKYYGVEEAEKIDEYEAICKMFGYLRMITVFDTDTPEWKKYFAAKIIKNNVIKNKERYIETFKKL